MCVEYLLRLPVPNATLYLGGLAMRMGAVKAAQFLGYRNTDGTRKKACTSWQPCPITLDLFRTSEHQWGPNEADSLYA